MKDKIKIYLTFIVCSMLLPGCSDDDDKVPVNKGKENRQAIQLVSSSGVNESTVGLRSAVTNLIGADNIGVIGALYTEGFPIVWTSYPDLNNVKAHAVGVNGGVYSFDWETQKYWPFDGTELVFRAYYPYTSNAVGSHVNISSDHESLSLSLPVSDPTTMPDVMVASGNMDADDRPLDKHTVNGLVNLGEFRHVLSQLTVEVVRKDNTVDPAIQVFDLIVSTVSSSGNLSLDDAQLSVADGNAATYRFINTPTPLTSIPASGYTAFFFPGTQDNVFITIVVGTPITNITRSYPISAFINVNGGEQDIVLERAKRTTVRIEVAGIPVQDAELNLKATLSEWNQKGDFVVNVK